MRSYQEKERELVAVKKPLLPAHAGESRYQAALDADFKFREMVLATYALALFSGVGFGQMASTAGLARTVLFCLIAVGFALRSVVTQGWRSTARLRTVWALTSLAGFAWVVWTAHTIVASPWDFAVAAVGCATLAILHLALARRTSFAPIVAALVVLHLAAFIGARHLQDKAIVPQMIILVLEFCLVGMAGYRHAIASLSRYPHATYRSSPQCLVPCLDHAWDHPLKIDAV